MRIDGSEGAAGAVVDGNASNLDLADNPFYRRFEDSIELSPDIAKLPAARGSGAVRDLLEAAQLSPELAAQLAALADAGYIDRDAYRARIVDLIRG
jgi:hypothetical protein